MLNMTTSLVGSLELAIMECFWADGPRPAGMSSRHCASSARLLILRSPRRSHACTTRGCSYALDDGRKKPWRYTARYRSRGALLAGTIEALCTHLEADRGDRAEALAVLLGSPR